MDKKEDLIKQIQEETIVYSNYCVSCYPNKKKKAVLIYQGNSLCEDCFKIEALK